MASGTGYRLGVALGVRRESDRKGCVSRRPWFGLDDRGFGALFARERGYKEGDKYGRA